ncbi:hypothetical protein VTO73DRAFT_9189 [Trametes versicolor]
MRPACTVSSTPNHDYEETEQEDGADPAQCMLPDKVSQLHITPDLVASPNSLPPELLQLIFEDIVYAADTVPKANGRLIDITHVCRYWRDVALHTPTLWTHIALTHSDAVKAFLKRSQELPLYSSVEATPEALANPKHMFNQVLQAVLAQYGRTSSLKVIVSWSHAFDSAIERIVGARTTQLEKLWIERLPAPDPLVSPENRPTDFDGVPRLRSLTLSGEFLPWYPRGPNALTEINLTSAVHDVHAMVSLLSRSPSLERVTVGGSFNEHTRRDARKVTLARLKRLHMHSYPIRGIAALLPSIVLPSKHTDISLASPYHYRNSGAFSDIMPAYGGAQVLDYAVLQGLRRVELLGGYGGQTLRAYRSSDIDDPAAPAVQIKMSRYLGTSVERFYVNWPFDASSVETLTVLSHPDAYRVASRELWWAMLAAVPALKTLRAEGMGNKMSGDLISVLAQGSLPLCDQLETLMLKDVILERPAWKALMDVVASRAPGAGGCLSYVELSLKGPAVWAQSTSRRIREAGVELVLSASVQD